MPLLTERELDRRIRRLQPLSETARALIETLEDPAHTREDLLAIVEKDGPLTARALGLVRSSALSPPSPIDSLERAIGYLGGRVLVAAALLDSTSQWMTAELEGYETGPAGLWASGLRGAIASRNLALADGKVPPAVAYTGALLRDIGKAILAPFVGRHIDKIRAELLGSARGHWCAAEREVLGTDHCAIGVRVGRTFRLSPALVAAIGHHHEPEKCPPEHRELVSVVHHADAIDHMLGGDPLQGRLHYDLDSGEAVSVALACSSLDDVLRRTLDEFEQTYAALAS